MQYVTHKRIKTEQSESKSLKHIVKQNGEQEPCSKRNKPKPSYLIKLVKTHTTTKQNITKLVKKTKQTITETMEKELMSSVYGMFVTLR